MSEKKRSKYEVLIKEKYRLKLLEIAIQDIFGICATLDWHKMEPEIDHITIRNIDWSDALIEVLARLSNDFYVEIETEIEYEESDGKKEPYSILVVNLYPREWEEDEEE